MIATVSLRLLYLILQQVLRLVLLLNRPSSTKDIELLVLRHEVAMAVGAGGLDRDRALRAVTIDAAKLLGIEKEYGSIEKGKVADLVLYDGDPFEHATHVTRTIMAGRVVYDRADYLKLPFERRILPLLAGGPGTGCCMAGW